MSQNKYIKQLTLLLSLLLITTNTYAEKIVVVHRIPGCSYYIADGINGLYILEWFGGYDPSKGDILVGEFTGFGFRDISIKGRGSGRVWVDNYLLSKTSAEEKIRDKCN